MAGEYHSKDFDWDELRDEIEKDRFLLYHLTPFDASSSSPSPCPPDAAAWKRFHKCHSTGRFFKERRYLLKEFPELLGCGSSRKVLEVGCGNGSTALPILKARPDIDVYACDCSSEALEFSKSVIETANDPQIINRFHTFPLDLSLTPFPRWLLCNSCRSASKPIYFDFSGTEEIKSTELSRLAHSEELKCCIGGTDFITMIFTLSAIPFQKMPFVIKECISVLKPGGFLLFRDYGLYDMSMLRFPAAQRVAFREYMRSDGTLSYFFSLDATRNLFVEAGFLELELEYCCVRAINHKNGKNMRRVWIHGKFQKPF